MMAGVEGFCLHTIPQGSLKTNTVIDVPEGSSVFSRAVPVGGESAILTVKLPSPTDAVGKAAVQFAISNNNLQASLNVDSDLHHMVDFAETADWSRPQRLTLLLFLLESNYQDDVVLHLFLKAYKHEDAQTARQSLCALFESLLVHFSLSRRNLADFQSGFTQFADFVRQAGNKKLAEELKSQPKEKPGITMIAAAKGLIASLKSLTSELRAVRDLSYQALVERDKVAFQTWLMEATWLGTVNFRLARALFSEEFQMFFVGDRVVLHSFYWHSIAFISFCGNKTKAVHLQNYKPYPGYPKFSIHSCQSTLTVFFVSEEGPQATGTVSTLLANTKTFEAFTSHHGFDTIILSSFAFCQVARQEGATLTVVAKQNRISFALIDLRIADEPGNDLSGGMVFLGHLPYSSFPYSGLTSSVSCSVMENRYTVLCNYTTCLEVGKVEYHTMLFVTESATTSQQITDENTKFRISRKIGEEETHAKMIIKGTDYLIFWWKNFNLHLARSTAANFLEEIKNRGRIPSVKVLFGAVLIQKILLNPQSLESTLCAVVHTISGRKRIRRVIRIDPFRRALLKRHLQHK